MIFTNAQWKSIQGDKIAVSPAPVQPCELAHSGPYVFALRPRYDFGLERGKKEVRQILTVFSQGKIC